MSISATTFFDTSDNQTVLRIDVGNPNTNQIKQSTSHQRDGCVGTDQGDLILPFPPSEGAVGHCKWWCRNSSVHILFWGESTSSIDNEEEYSSTVQQDNICPKKATVCFPDNIQAVSLSIAPKLNQNHNTVTVVVTAATQLAEILCVRIDVSIPSYNNQRQCQVAICAPYNITSTLPQEKMFLGSSLVSMAVIGNPALACADLLEQAESNGSVPLVVCAITNGFSVWVVQIFEDGGTTAVPSLSLGRPPPLTQSPFTNTRGGRNSNRSDPVNWSTITLNSSQAESIEDGSESEEDHSGPRRDAAFELMPVLPFRKRTIQSLITVPGGFSPLFGIMQSDGTIVMIHIANPLVMVFYVNVPVKGSFDTPLRCTCRVAKDRYIFAIAGSKQRVAFISSDIATKESKVLAVVARPPGKHVSVSSISISLADHEETGSQIPASNHQLKKSQCTIVWSECELWTAPVTPLTVMAGGAANNANRKEIGCDRSSTIVGVYDITQRVPIHHFIWSGSNVSSHPFVTHFGGLGPYRNATILCDVNPTKGTTSVSFIDLYRAYSSEPLSICSSAVLGNLEPNDGYTSCGISECSVVPTSIEAFGGVATSMSLEDQGKRGNLLFSNNDIAPEHLAFAEGLSLFYQIDKGPMHLHYLFNRTVISASRFVSLAEFQDLCCNLTEAYVTSQWAVSETDMAAAIDWVMSCDNMKDVPFCLTPRFVYQASLQDLSARLIFIILSYSAWVCGPNGAECTYSPLIRKVCYAVESIVAGIRVINGLCEDTIRFTTATASSANIKESPPHIYHISSNNNNEDVPQQPCGVISRVVWPLIKNYGSVRNVLNVAANLADMRGANSLRALNAWVAVHRVHNPLVCHFNIESIIKSCRTSGASGAVVVGDSMAVAMQLSQLPTDGLQEVFELLGSFHVHNIPDLANLNIDDSTDGHYSFETTTDHVQQQFIKEATEFACQRHPELAAKVYRVMLLRQLLDSSTHTSIINPTALESSFLPDLHIIRRCVFDLVQDRLEEEALDNTDGTEDDKDRGDTAATLTPYYLNEFLRNLLVDTMFFLTRAAIDNQDYTEALRLLSVAIRESKHRKLETAYYYIIQIVNNALVEGRSSELSDVRTCSAELQSLIAFRLRYIVFDSREPFSNMHPHSSIHISSSPSRVSQIEHDRFQAALTLCNFLYKRHSYGFVANLMFQAADRLRRVQLSTPIVNGESMVVQLMSHAVEAASNIPDVLSAPPMLEAMYRTFSDHTNEYEPKGTIISTEDNHKQSGNENEQNEKALCLRLLVNPHSVVSEWPLFRSPLEPSSKSTKQDISLSRKDIPQLRFRHYQAHCERLLFQRHVSVDYAPWTVENAQLSGRGSSAISLSNVRNTTKDLLKKLLREGFFTEEAMQLARLFVNCSRFMIHSATDGDDAFTRESCLPGGKNDLRSFVVECRASSLASRDYATDANIAAEWALFVEYDLIPDSNLANGYLYLKQALSAALSVNPRHIPPVLINALKKRDLCGLLYCYLASGQPIRGGSYNGSFATNENTTSYPSVGSSTNIPGIEAVITGNRRIHDATLAECFTIGGYYIQAMCEIEEGKNQCADNPIPSKQSSFEKYDLPPGAFVSDPVLERLVILAKCVACPLETTMLSTSTRSTEANVKRVQCAAEEYIRAFQRFTKI